MTTEGKKNPKLTAVRTCQKAAIPKKESKNRKCWFQWRKFFPMGLEGWDSPGWNLHICWKRPAIWTPRRSHVFFWHRFQGNGIYLSQQKKTTFHHNSPEVKIPIVHLNFKKKMWLLYNNSKLNGRKGVKKVNDVGFLMVVGPLVPFLLVDISTAKNPGARVNLLGLGRS